MFISDAQDLLSYHRYMRLSDHALREVHIVCEYADSEELVAVTVYVPDRPNWINDVARGR